jgi:undecaprenyl-diphosphatase
MQQILALAVVQGITEFLPISSSGHLVLVPHFLGWHDQGLAMDVANHVGSLGAVVAYFWRDVRQMLIGGLQLFSGRWSAGAQLALMLAIGTIPAIAAGLIIKHYFPEGIRSIKVIGFTTIGYAILLYLVDRVSSSARSIDTLRIRDAFLIGCAQALALIPGTSRSGITMTCGRGRGFSRTESARFSFLLAIPAIAGAGILEGAEIVKSGQTGMITDAAFIASFSFLSSLAAIWFLMAWLRRSSFTPFVVYRLILGLIVLSFAYGIII